MRVGVPKEIKTEEYRVGLIPSSVRELTEHGHDVVIEESAGIGIGISDDAYQAAGATTVDTAEEVFASADLIVKVKEPQAQECKLLREGQTLFTYLHLAADKKQAELLIESKGVAIAYETVTDGQGGLPLLAPMSEVAGRMATQVGAQGLEKPWGGAGILLGGVPGVVAAHVVIIGGGVAGTNAARMAMGMEARVTVIDKCLSRLYDLDLQFGATLNTIFATRDVIEKYTADADLVICAVLVPGGAAPKLITRKTLKAMRPGSVIVDISVDQGGCCETSRPTTHADPYYEVDGVVHYCVSNMPGAVPRTSAFALNNATLPFVLDLANKGYRQALIDDPHLRNGLNVHCGTINCKPVARDLGLPYQPTDVALGL